jgi:osmotically inducible protein OsmC
MQLSAYIGEWILKLKVSKLNAILIYRWYHRNLLTVNAKVKGFQTMLFNNRLQKQKNCPISKVLNAAISTTATLVQ